MKKQNTAIRSSRSRRVTAVIASGLAGVMLMCSVPAVAIAADVSTVTQVTSMQTAADSNATTTVATKWEDYNGGAASDGTKAVVKNMVGVIAGMVGKKPGDALQALLGLVAPDESTQYTTNQIMHQLYDMENQISGVSSQVYSLQSSLSSFKAELFSRSSFAAIKGFKELLASDDEGVRTALVNMSRTLSEYKELDENGNVTDAACSLTTPVDRMPKEAREAVSDILAQLDRQATTYTSKTVAGAEYTLYTSVCSSESGNIVSDYFNLLNNAYNWDVETFDAKQNFITHLAQMYTNAYMVESAQLNLELADAKAAGKSTALIENSIDSLHKRAARFRETLYGENGDGGFYALTLQKGGRVTNYVSGRSYETGTYANVAAYGSVNDENDVSGKNVFEEAYVRGHSKTIDTMADNWDVKSAFTSDQVVTMVQRLNALKSAGLAPKKADGTAVDGILEEMGTLGFQTVKTDGNDKDTTWNGHFSKTTGRVKTALGGLIDIENVRNTLIELGDPTQSTVIPEHDEFHMGKRLTNSSDWVLTKVKKPRCSAGSKSCASGFGSEKNCFHAYCAYGDVVNVKTGEKVEDQLLYVLRITERGGNTSDAILEYYAFGVLAPGTVSASLGNVFKVK